MIRCQPRMSYNSKVMKIKLIVLTMRAHARFALFPSFVDSGQQYFHNELELAWV